MTAGILVGAAVRFFGGVGLFIYGMKTAGWGLQKVAGRRMRRILSTFTDTPLKGTLIGALMAATIQSSSATTVMLVGFVNASLMDLGRALGVVYGANIGTTFTVQLIAFPIAEWSLLLVGVGVLLTVVKRNRLVPYVGQSVLGFGLVFLGLHVLSGAAEPLRSDPGLARAVLALSDRPLLGMAAAALFTAVIQSSAATIGLAMVLAGQGMLDLSSALPIILGADIGTCSTALLSSVGTSREGKRVAVAHLLFNLIGAALVYPFLDAFRGLVLWTSAPFTRSLSRRIANAHMLFKVLNTLLFLPLTRPFQRLITLMLPVVPELERPFRIRYLDEQVLDTPEIALDEACKETERMGRRVLAMLERGLEVFRSGDDLLREEVKKMDNEVDFLDDAVTRYLTALSQRSLTADQSAREAALLFIADDLEHIGDLVDKNLMELARKKIDAGLEFSPEGRQEIEDMFLRTRTNVAAAVEVFVADDRARAAELQRELARVDRLEAELRRAHIRRLHEGLKETLETSTIHLDVISNLKQINAHAASIVQAVLGEAWDPGA